MNSLILVNGLYPCPADAERDLIPVCADHPDILLEREAVRALSRIMEQLGGWGSIVPVSGWRSSEEQLALYGHSLRENGPEFTEKFVAAPGHSEHETSLAIDLGLRQAEIDLICPAFPYEGICQKFRELAPAYGFVERYPRGKEHITGIAHEPWHFRYVNTPHSEIMAFRGLTLEEYLAWIKYAPL